MKRQSGLTLTGFILVAAIVVVVAVLGFRIVPVYVEYNAIQRQFRSMAEDSALREARRPELERAWAARATVENIRSLSAEDIDYSKQGERWVISGQYSVKVPLFRNVSACFDFAPSSQ